MCVCVQSSISRLDAPDTKGALYWIVEEREHKELCRVGELCRSAKDQESNLKPPEADALDPLINRILYYNIVFPIPFHLIHVPSQYVLK